MLRVPEKALLVAAPPPPTGTAFLQGLPSGGVFLESDDRICGEWFDKNTWSDDMSISQRAMRLIAATRNMRALQREYFRTRDVGVLRDARQAENLVDKLAEGWNDAGEPIATQRELFEKET